MKARELTERICAVVHLSHQHPMVLHRVVLDPAKIVDNLIRLGDYPGDEAAGWNYLDAVEILHILGTVEFDPDKREVKITPIS